jgi:hypothetical protein
MGCVANWQALLHNLRPWRFWWTIVRIAIQQCGKFILLSCNKFIHHRNTGCCYVNSTMTSLYTNVHLQNTLSCCQRYDLIYTGRYFCSCNKYGIYWQKFIVLSIINVKEILQMGLRWCTPTNVPNGVHMRISLFIRFAPKYLSKSWKSYCVTPWIKQPEWARP